jgi:ankyrin repeat protein
MLLIMKIITPKRTGAAAAFILAIIISLVIFIWPNAHQYRQALLIDAALRGYTGRMRLLLALGANADEPACQSDSCFPPIVWAALAEEPSAVELLLDHGANVNRKPRRGATALTAAAFHGDTETVKLLLSRGADINSDLDGCTPLGLAKLRKHAEVVNLLSKQGASRDGDCESFW